jgi:hypothetical protein
MRTVTEMDARLNELAELRDGWMNGGGRGISSKGAAWLGTLLRELVEKHAVEPPHLYPTE